MASVRAIGSEVFGSCVGGIFVSVELKNGDGWLCCGWKYMRFIWAVKAAQYLRWRLEMVPGIGGRFRCFGVD
jgi:hypothetical protein